MEFCELSNVLDGYVDNDPAGPLEVLEESTRHVWMAVMAQSLRIIQHLCATNPDPAVPAAVAEQTLDKCVEFSQACGQDSKTLSRELRVECVHAMALLGRYDVALQGMERPVVRLVECMADLDGEVQFAAAQSLILLLDASAELLPSMLPAHELEALMPSSAALHRGSAPISPYQGPPQGRALEACGGGTGGKGGRREAETTAQDRADGEGEGVRVVLPAARGALRARHFADVEGEEEERGGEAGGGVEAGGGSSRGGSSPVVRDLRCQLDGEYDRRAQQSQRARLFVRYRLVEMFAGCSANPERFLEVTDVADKVCG